METEGRRAASLRGSEQRAPSLYRRRSVLGALGAWCLTKPLSSLAAADAPTGLVEPRLPAPPMRLQLQDGHQTTLTELLRGRPTALQLMFTACSSSCPVQGALFAAVAGLGLPANTQLLSISIDALGDNPATLGRWLGQFGRVPAWSAAVPKVDDVEPLSAWLKGAKGKPGTHTAQVFFFDAAARLCYRSGDFPPARDIRALLAQLGPAT